MSEPTKAVDYAGQLIARRAERALVWYQSGRPTLERIGEALDRVEMVKRRARRAHSETMRVEEQLTRIQQRLAHVGVPRGEPARRLADG